MSLKKIALSLETDVLADIDRLARSGGFRSRSQFIRSAIEQKTRRVDKARLALECAKLDMKVEQAMAEEQTSISLRI